jgi:hypothetical protein
MSGISAALIDAWLIPGNVVQLDLGILQVGLGRQALLVAPLWGRLLDRSTESLHRS